MTIYLFSTWVWNNMNVWRQSLKGIKVVMMTFLSADGPHPRQHGRRVHSSGYVSLFCSQLGKEGYHVSILNQPVCGAGGCGTITHRWTGWDGNGGRRTLTIIHNVVVTLVMWSLSLVLLCCWTGCDSKEQPYLRFSLVWSLWRLCVHSWRLWTLPQQNKPQLDQSLSKTGNTHTELLQEP